MVQVPRDERGAACGPDGAAPLGAVLLGYSVLDVPQMALALEMAHAQRMGQEALAVVA